MDLESSLTADVVALVARAAIAVAEVARQPDLGVRLKGRVDPVTLADERSEEILFEGLSALFPADRIVAEEGHAQASNNVSQATWYVDPLDGTVNFAHRHPPYAVTVGCCDAAGPQFGLVHEVASGTVWIGARGQGAWRDGQRIHVSDTSPLERAMLVTGFPYWLRDRPDEQNNLLAFNRMMKTAQTVRREGSASVDLARVADGTNDGFWEIGLKPWDVAAGIVLVQEAHGVVTGLDGGAYVDLEAPIVASNGNIHPAMLEVLRTAIVYGKI